MSDTISTVRRGLVAIGLLLLAGCTMPDQTQPAQDAVPEENARSFVSISSSGRCGPAGFGGQFLQIRNAHPSRAITVSYAIRYIYQGQQRSERRTGTWSPQRTNPLGCTVPGPTGQRFDYQITDARF